MGSVLVVHAVTLRVPARGGRFVVKTHDDTGRKMFINICGNPKIPAPGNWDNGKVPEKVQKALGACENPLQRVTLSGAAVPNTHNSPPCNQPGMTYMRG